MLNINLAYGQELKLAGPAAVVSYPLMVMTEQQKLTDSAIKFSFTRWKSPNRLRAMVIGEQIDFTAMPSNLAAIFYNKGHSLTLLNISIWNIMDIVSRDKEITSLNDLVGQEIVVPFKNDMPSIILQKLLHTQLKDKATQVRIRHSHNLADAAQLLLAGKVKHALLIEPLSSIVLYQNAQKGNSTLSRTINISQQWKNTFPNSPKLPQAGIIANTTINGDKALVSAVNDIYKTAALWCEEHVSSCADIVKKHLPKMPKPALISAIKNTKVKPINSSVAKADIQAFYQLLAEYDAKRIGGKQPNENFYF